MDGLLRFLNSWTASLRARVGRPPRPSRPPGRVPDSVEAWIFGVQDACHRPAMRPVVAAFVVVCIALAVWFSPALAAKTLPVFLAEGMVLGIALGVLRVMRRP